MVWCIAAPFLIGNISQGRTVRQTISQGYLFGVGSTIVSFIVLGNYSLGLQTAGAADFIAQYEKTGDLYELIMNIVHTMPISRRAVNNRKTFRKFAMMIFSSDNCRHMDTLPQVFLSL